MLVGREREKKTGERDKLAGEIAQRACYEGSTHLSPSQHMGRLVLAAESEREETQMAMKLSHGSADRGIQIGEDEFK